MDILKLYGKRISKNELMKRIGEISQIAGLKEYILSQGKSRGVRAIDVKTGGGFNFTVLPDRGMDIAWADYNSMPISFMSNTGVVSPAYFEEYDNNFYRSFFAGLMTTCGLTYLGAQCMDEGKKLGVHGRINNIPAEEVCAYSEWIKDDLQFKVIGKVRESKVDEENILLRREIIARLGENKIIIKNSIENCGYEKTPLMVIFHINLGFPFLDEDCFFSTSEGIIIPRDEEAEKGLNNYGVFSKPIHNCKEQVFYHKLKENNGKKAYSLLFNKKLGFGFYVKFNLKELPCFSLWKQLGEGTYALGMEPGTNYPESRNRVREKKEITYIEPGEIREFSLEMGIINDLNEINNN
jgi:hypothetical protein